MKHLYCFCQTIRQKATRASGLGLLLLSLISAPMVFAQDNYLSNLPDSTVIPGQGTASRMILSGQVTQSATWQEPQLQQEVFSPGIVGLDLVVRPHSYPFIKGVFEGTPADEQGLAAGDLIVAVNHVSTFGKTRHQVDDQIPDRPGTPVHFQIQRQGQLYQVRLVVAPLNQLPSAVQSVFNNPTP